MTGFTIASDDGVMGQLSSIPNASSEIEAKINAVFQYFFYRRQAAGDSTTGTETLYAEDGLTPIGTSALTDTGATFNKERVV